MLLPWQHLFLLFAVFCLPALPPRETRLRTARFKNRHWPPACPGVVHLAAIHKLIVGTKTVFRTGYNRKLWYDRLSENF